MNFSKAMTAGLVAAALTMAAGVNAAMIKSVEEATVKVDARGIDLNSERGQEMLYDRLQRAAKKVCGSTSVREVGSLKSAMDNQACFDETLSKAVESVGNRSLSRIHKTS